MRSIRFDTETGPRWGRLIDDVPGAPPADAPATVDELDGAPWENPRILGRREVPAASLLAPATPTKIVCVGRNYVAHAAELGNEVPTTPLLFLKPATALLAPGAAIVRPAVSERVDHEGELALVMGSPFRVASTANLRDEAVRAAAAAAVHGISVANDVTARDLQREDGKFTRGKGFDTFCPLGPELLAVDAAALLVPRRVRTIVRSREGVEELRQDGNTEQMVFDPIHLVAFVASIMTLAPGDVLLTGTPAGVGPLVAGDTVRVEVEGLTPLESTVRDEGR